MNNPFSDILYFDIPNSQNPEIVELQDPIMLAVVEKEDFDQNSDLILNILKAIKMEADKNVSILKLDPNAHLNLNAIYQKHGFKYLISFGVSLDRLSININFGKNKCIQTETYQLIYTDKLKDLNEQKQNKLALWNELKTIFG